MNKKKVLLGMSGGIDSSLAALLLLEQGYDVVGLTMQMWDDVENDPRHHDQGSSSTDSIHEAKAVADQLNIPHHTENIVDEFNQTVVCNFVNEYLNGKTPNPCVLCNTQIKWKVLQRKAKALNCDYIATGHYAQIVKSDTGFLLKRAKDQKKDQSYFLWGLAPEILKKIILPLGQYTKDQIRKMAAENGFVKLAQQKESQEICFIPDNDYRSYLRKNVPGIEQKIGPGDFISTDGKILGQHEGYPFYTIGQRKGLKIALGKPMYVLNINARNNEIVLGKRSELYQKELRVKNFNLMAPIPPDQAVEVITKVRYKSEGIRSTLKMEGSTIRIHFRNEVFAITPGQSAVFYANDILLGGGIIV
ncbi:MAG: tRNA 2-thiouridine(34) synthase MnmA [Bacteroidales bacterium]|jgi:tRNA-specific 2-thiouridylase|nr:tRNA 2-thiouridine(34) synthase MnmA [Bacteroidales bacterium]